MESGSHFLLLGLCTYRRPLLLREALESLTKLQIPLGLRVDFLLVDNEEPASSSARQILNKMKQELPFDHVEYEKEERRGISHARNRVIERALEKGAHFIAFFDDDARVAPDWLERMYHYFKKEGGEVITGPQKTLLPPKAPAWAYRSEFLQAMRFTTGTKRPWAATHNVFFAIKLVREWGLRFDSSFALSGGDDQFFFMQAVQKGARIHWLEEAVVTEKIAPERLELGWILKRNFRYSCDGAAFYRKLFGPWKASLLVLFKGLLYTAYGFFFLFPFGLLAFIALTRHHSIQALAYMARGLGWFLGWGGYRYEEYKKR